MQHFCCVCVRVFFAMALQQCCTMCQRETSEQSQMLENKCYAILLLLLLVTLHFIWWSFKSVHIIYLHSWTHSTVYIELRISSALTLTLCIAKLQSMLSRTAPLGATTLCHACVNICKNVSRKCCASSLDSEFLSVRWLCHTYDSIFCMCEYKWLYYVTNDRT